MKPRIYYSLLLGFLLCACATTRLPVQDERFISETTLPPVQTVEHVPFVQQAEKHCGPAALAMVLHLQQEVLAAQMFTPAKQGTLQSDLLGASRRQGYQAVVIHGTSRLLQEIAAGNPVIVLENLGLSWYPQWHYSVIFGYDLPARTWTFHSGRDANKKEDFLKFERRWALADHWGLVVLPPDRLSASGSELEHAAEGAVLEQLGNIFAAEKVYKEILKKWPSSLIGHIGLGNTLYAQNDFKTAARVLARAAELHPENQVVRLNLATVNESLSPQERGKIPR